jgi:hypothetical protein
MARLDWNEFFSRVKKPHGFRVRLVGVESSSPRGLLTEKRLVRIVRARAGSEPFALRRSFASGPAIIDCVFAAAALADEVAGEIGAVPVNPPLGWATARELAADDQVIRRILKMGAEVSRPRIELDVPLIEGVMAPAKNRIEPPAEYPSGLGYGASQSPIAVVEAVKRLATMSPGEQAAALFESMMAGRK